MEEILQAPPGTPESDEVDILTALIERYEEKTNPTGLQDPIGAIRIRMEELGLQNRDLEELLVHPAVFRKY